MELIALLDFIVIKIISEVDFSPIIKDDFEFMPQIRGLPTFNIFVGYAVIYIYS